VDKIKLQPLLTDSQNQSWSFSGWRMIAIYGLAIALPGAGLGIILILMGYQKLDKKVAGQRAKAIAQIVGGVVLIVATGAFLILR
jgi:hypothetical protein